MINRKYITNVGDLVIRKDPSIESWEPMGVGIVLAQNMAGNPSHPCLEVYYPKFGKTYSIAESLVEVVCAGR